MIQDNSVIISIEDDDLGTGLGLSISHDIIVNKHKGLLSVKNNPQKDACLPFRFLLWGGAAKMKRILLVDDEIQILNSLKRLFIDEEYELLTADSGEQALNILSMENISLIISDMRMPVMDGFQLLSKVMNLYPKIPRVILSGYADEKLVYNAIDKSIAMTYVFKPWKTEQLLNLIEQIFETEDVLESKDLLLLVNNMGELPTIKSSHQRIISVIESGREISEIVKMIELDPAISTKLLRISNSAFFGIKTGSVNQAVKYLGLQNVSNLILSIAIMDSTTVVGVGAEHVEKLWRHANVTNKIILFIYSKLFSKSIPEISTSAGLLHNIGTVFLLKCFPKEYIRNIKSIEKESKELIKYEKSVFKVSHQEIGGYLLRWWKLPHPIVEAALYHHNPLDACIVNTELVCCVHIAQKYAWDLMGDDHFTEFYYEAFQRIGINQREFENRIREISLD